MTHLTTQEITEQVNQLSIREIGREGYRERLNELEQQWRAYLLDAHFPPGTSDEEFSVVYRRAWREGHALGYSEVENYLLDLLDFLDEWKRAAI